MSARIRLSPDEEAPPAITSTEGVVTNLDRGTNTITVRRFRLVDDDK